MTYFIFLSIFLNVLLVAIIIDNYNGFGAQYLTLGEPLLSVFIAVWTVTAIWYSVKVINKKKAVEPTIAYLPFNKIGCEALQDKGTPKYTRNILLATTFVIYLTTTKSTVKVKAPY